MGGAILAQPVNSRERPNILMILMDDMAARSLSCYGNPHVRTPHLDQLASEGVRFTQAYVTPQCTPTRASLLTGQYTARNRMWHVIPWYGTPWGRVQEPDFVESLPRTAFNLARGLKSAGWYNATLLASIEHMDAAIGRLLARLRELGQSDNTAVFFMTDNGGICQQFSPQPLRTADGG